MKKLYVDTFLKDQAPLLGQSRPLLVMASDGEEYFIKNNMVRFESEWHNENAAFFNEIVSSRVANYLEIPTPEIAILELETDVMSANSDLLFNRHFKAGLYFGSKKIEQVENNLMSNYLELIRMNKPYIRRSWNTFFNNISNPKDISSIIVLDLLLANFDRFDNIGNLIVGQNNNKRSIYALDHGHCFRGPFYDTNKEQFLRSNDNLNSDNLNSYILTQIQQIIINAQYNENGHARPFNTAGEVFKAVEPHIDLSDIDNHSFVEPVSKVEQLTPEFILNFFEGIPDEWIDGGQSQIRSYSNFIYRQSNLIRDIIQKMTTLNAFSNYRGGLLNWKQEKVIGIQ